MYERRSRSRARCTGYIHKQGTRERGNKIKSAAGAALFCCVWSELPGYGRREELGEEVVVVGLEFGGVGLGVALGVEVVLVELEDPIHHGAVLVIAEVVVCAVLVPWIERVEAEHVERFVAEVGFHDFSDVAVVAEGHVDVLETAVGLVNAGFGLVLGDIAIGIIGEVLGEDDVGRPGASDGEGVADDAPLGFAIQAEAFAEVVEKADEDHPARMAVATDRFRCLEKVLDLGEVGIGVAVVDEGVEEFGGLPDGLLALLEGEVLLLFAEDVVDGLVLVVEAVELGYAGRGLGVIYAELFLALALFIASGEKAVPFFEVVQGVVGIGVSGAVECDAHRRASCAGTGTGRGEDAPGKGKLTPALAGCKFRRCDVPTLGAKTKTRQGRGTRLICRGGLGLWVRMNSDACGFFGLGMNMKVVVAKCMLLTACFVAAGALAQQPGRDVEVHKLHEGFAHPPSDSRIMMRWWWFGPSATKEELRRELEQMKAAGIGGVEIATLYPLALEDPKSGFHNYDFVSDEHLENLKFAAEEARRLGLRVDVTLGSGWPFGGPQILVTQSAGELRVEPLPVGEGETSVTKPALEAGETLIAAFVSPAKDGTTDFRNAKEVPVGSGSRLRLPEEGSGSARVATFFVSSRTGMMVKRAAQGAAGFVLDHYDAAAIRNHLEAVGDCLVSAFGDQPPYAVFSDSLEDYGSDWTPNLQVEFQKRRGYDLKPFLPALVGDMGPATAAIRHDWGETLTELANENFLRPLEAWAGQHHTKLRSQTYGYPPVTLSSNRLVDLPEGEGKATVNMWRAFSDTRWAASAGHLFGNNVISSETWTWLHSPAFRATPLDMKAEADLHFLQGINQLVGHGWPYSPPEAGEPGWRMYAAGALDAHNPWFMAMPDLAGYLQRVSYALRLGKPANDVAVLLPNDDVWASFKARMQKNKSALSVGGFDETGSNVSMDESMPKFLGKEVIPQILDAGFNFDFIDGDAIEAVGIPYKVLVLPGVDRIAPGKYEKVLEFAKQGGIVLQPGGCLTLRPDTRMRRRLLRV
jgi:hypothetical protein